MDVDLFSFFRKFRNGCTRRPSASHSESFYEINSKDVIGFLNPNSTEEGTLELTNAQGKATQQNAKISPSRSVILMIGGRNLFDDSPQQSVEVSPKNSTYSLHFKETDIDEVIEQMNLAQASATDGEAESPSVTIEVESDVTQTNSGSKIITAV